MFMKFVRLDDFIDSFNALEHISRVVDQFTAMFSVSDVDEGGATLIRGEDAPVVAFGATLQQAGLAKFYVRQNLLTRGGKPVVGHDNQSGAAAEMRLERL